MMTGRPQYARHQHVLVPMPRYHLSPSIVGYGAVIALEAAALAGTGGGSA